MDTQGFDVTINSPLVDDGTSSNGGLRKLGNPTVSTGVLRLGAINTYTGNTNIDQGFLVTNVSGALPSTTVVNFNNVGGAVSRLDLGGTNQKVQGLVPSTNRRRWRTAVLSSGGLGSIELATPSGQTFSFGGAIGGAGTQLIKSGSGTQILTGAGTFTGRTTISGGTLQIGSGVAGASGASGTLTGPVTIGAGASLLYFRDNNQNSGFGFGAGVISGAGDIVLQGEQNGYYSITNAQGGFTNTGLTTVNLTYTANDFRGTLFLEGSATNRLSPDSVLNVLSGAVDFRSSQIVAGVTGTPGGYLISDAAASTLTMNVAAGKTYSFGGIVGKGPGFGSDGSLSLNKLGAGTQILAGANTSTTNTTVAGGTLGLDFTTQNNPKLGGALVLGGGILSIIPNAGADTVQSVPTTTLNPGASGVTVNKNGAANNATLNLNAITRTAGGTLNVITGGTGTGVASVTTDNLNTAAGILGGWATVNGTTWAINSTNAADGAITALGAGAYTPNTWAAGTHTDVTSSSAPASGSTTETLRFNTAGANTITLAGVNTVNSGGILITSAVGSNATTFTGGTLRGASGADLILHQLNAAGALNMDSLIADNTTATQLTKIGPGTLNLTNSNTYTGATNIFGGVVVVPTMANGGVASPLGASPNASANLVFNNGTLRYTGPTVSSDRGFQVNDVGTFDVPTAGTTLTMGGAGIGVGSVVKTGPGNLILGGANTYSGNTTISAGNFQNGNNNVSGVLGGGNYSVAAGSRLTFSRNVDNVAFSSQSISGGGDVAFTGQDVGYFTFRGDYTGSLSYSGRTIVNYDAVSVTPQWFGACPVAGNRSGASSGHRFGHSVGKSYLARQCRTG